MEVVFYVRVELSIQPAPQLVWQPARLDFMLILF